MNELRLSQQIGFELAVKHLAKNNRFRFNMVTGSGKTVLAIKTADHIFPDGIKVVSVHTLNLKKQFEEEIKRHSSNPLLWVVNTYQSLRSIKMECDILIVDEVHQGGQESEGSYKKIIKNIKPKKIISLSATDYNVDEKLFGKERYCYGLEQASKDKIINECDIITIDTGLNQILSNKDKISKEKLSHIYDENIKRKVDLKSKKSIDVIHDNNIRSALEVYLREERGNQAILFVHNIEWCEKAYQIAQEMRINSNYIHSKIKDAEVKNTIDSFKRQEFDLLISIRQLREGFDFPYLEVAIDCAPSFTNEGRDFKQKCGRILRVAYGKKKSRYYIINCLNKFSSDLDLHDSLIANIEVSTRNDLRVNKLTNREILLPIGEVKGNTKRYSLFVEHTDSFKENGRKNLFELVSKHDPKSKKKILLEMAKNGEDRPKIGDKLYHTFYAFINKNKSSYDHHFTEEIYKANPKWRKTIGFAWLSLLEKVNKKTVINDLTKNEKSVLYMHTDKRSKNFNIKKRKEIKKLAPLLFNLENIQKQRLVNRMLKTKQKRGFLGVTKMKSGKYRAYISVKRKFIILGYFFEEKQAIKAREAAERKYWNL